MTKQGELLVALVQKLDREATDPDSTVRQKAEKRMSIAFEALSGRSWTTYRQLRIILNVMRMAADQQEWDFGVHRLSRYEPALATQESLIRAAVDGCAGGKKVWPPLLDLLRAANLAGGITDSDHLKRKFLAATEEMTEEDRSFFGR